VGQNNIFVVKKSIMSINGKKSYRAFHGIGSAQMLNVKDSNDEMNSPSISEGYYYIPNKVIRRPWFRPPFRNLTIAV
jgi:hypothetical protein